MRIKQIFRNLIFAFLVGVFLWMMKENLKVNTDPTGVFFQTLTEDNIYLISALCFALFMAFSLHKKGLSDEVLEKEKQKLILDTLEPEQKEKVKTLNIESLNLFFENYYEEMEVSKKVEINQRLYDLKQDTLTVGMKIVRLLVFACVVFMVYQVFLPCSNAYTARLNEIQSAYQTPISDQVLYYDGIPPIELVSGNTFQTGRVQEVVDQAIRTQPQFLLDRCSKIYLMADEYFNASYYDQSTDVNQFEGWADSYDMSIKIRLSDTSGSSSDIKLYVSHELGHIFDFSFGNVYTAFGISSGQEIQDFYYQNPGVLREYGATNAEEFFAVAVEYYFNKPEEFKQKSMELYQYMESLFAPYL